MAPPFSTTASKGGSCGSASAPGRLQDADDFPEFVELEDWEFEETIRQAQHLLRSVSNEPALTRSVERSSASTDTRTDVEQPGQRSPEISGGPAIAPVKSGGRDPWEIPALGLGVFVCGAALMGLSLAKDSAPLWQVGLPMALLGQLVLLFVVIWQLDVAWLSNRATFMAYRSVDEQLRQLQMRTTSQEAEVPESATFSRHVAQNSAPHLMLKNLREQIDELSAELAKSRDAA
ncbi:MAG: hypothetical protein ACYC0X_05790 [Pirellulaceae bacterium]